MMKKMRSKLNLLLCMMLITSMGLMVNGCGDSQTKSDNATDTEVVSGVQTDTETTSAVQTDTETISGVQTEAESLGEGEKTFMFTVVDADGNETAFEIHTDDEMVGEALLALGLIAGDDGDYGLYVKEVNGIAADYDVDGTYWAFYVNDEYATTGVDQTPVADGDSYAFKVEK